MSLKDRILQILEKSRAMELEFIASLTDGERAYEGTFEKWSAKDTIAHANYWEDVRAMRAVAWSEGVQLDPVPQFEQANAECYAQYEKHTWTEIEAFTKQAHEKMVAAVQGLSQEVLEGPSEESEGRKMWETLVGAAFSHKLMHYTDFYHERGQHEVVSRLWAEWVDLVSPLDEGADWQGGVNYNAACSLALAGDEQGALDKLRVGLDLRPNLRGWSRRDSDLALLHDLPEYKALIAPDYWWEALEAGPQAEAISDQYIRSLTTFRVAVNSCPENEWLQGETLYQRPAGLALHIAQSINYYSAIKSGEEYGDALMEINWQERDSSNLPSQKEMLQFIDKVERRLAHFIANANLEAKEELFPWTGFTILGRTVYALRHMTHHLADLIMELKHRGVQPPSWN